MRRGMAVAQGLRRGEGCTTWHATALIKWGVNIFWLDHSAKHQKCVLKVWNSCMTAPASQTMSIWSWPKRWVSWVVRCRVLCRQWPILQCYNRFLRKGRLSINKTGRRVFVGPATVIVGVVESVCARMIDSGSDQEEWLVVVRMNKLLVFTRF